MSVRQRAVKIFVAIKNGGKQSLRKLSIHLGLSRSSIDRHQKALEKRDCHPESWMWETPEGQQFLALLVFAVIFEFGIKGGNGAERLSQFFKRIHLEKHFGASPTAILTQTRRMEELIATFQRICEELQSQKGISRGVVVGGDETFFA